MSLYSAIAARFGRRYDRWATVLTSSIIRAELRDNPLFANSGIYLKDGEYLCLAPDRLGDFVSDNAWAIGKHYRKDVFDCDDFAACTRADLLRAGHDLGFKKAVCVSEVCYWKKDGAYHAANLLVDAVGGLWLLEPQDGAMTKDLAAEIASVCQVWG